MSPSLYKWKSFRFYFFSREEPRAHVHVTGPEGEAKYWLDPDVALATSHGLPEHTLRGIEEQVRIHADEFKRAWKTHFGS